MIEGTYRHVTQIDHCPTDILRHARYGIHEDFDNEDHDWMYDPCPYSLAYVMRNTAVHSKLGHSSDDTCAQAYPEIPRVSPIISHHNIAHSFQHSAPPTPSRTPHKPSALHERLNRHTRRIHPCRVLISPHPDPIHHILRLIPSHFRDRDQTTTPRSSFGRYDLQHRIARLRPRECTALMWSPCPPAAAARA